MDLRPILADIFREQRSVSPLELRRVLGVSRQTAWKRVRRLIEIGALVPEGVGRGRRYVPGTGIVEAPDPTEMYNRFKGVWSALAERVREVSYVALYLHPTALIRKTDAEAILWAIPYWNFLILDFDRVEQIGDAFAREIFFGKHGSVGKAVAINASPRVQRTLARVFRTELTRPPNSVGGG